MDMVRLVNFKSAHPNEHFPSFRELEAMHAKKIRDSLVLSFGVAQAENSLALVLELDSLAETLDGVDAESRTFDLQATLQNAGIRPQPHVLLTWDRFDKFDQMLTDDVVAVFSSIWYPSSDDLSICDDTAEWILSITHYGAVKVARANRVRS